MLSRTGRPLAELVLGPVARLLVRLGVGADVVTWVGTALTTAAALVLVPSGHLAVGAAVLAVLVVCDSLDGQIARTTGTASTWGAFLDSTLDRVADAALFGALAWWALVHLPPPLAGWTAGAAVVTLAASLVVSYTKARAEAVGLHADVGLVERADRLVVALASMLLVGLGLPPVVLTLVLGLLAIASVVTVAQRMAVVRAQARTVDGERTG